MNKLIGFHNLVIPAIASTDETESGPSFSVPLKFGTFAIDSILEEFSIELGDIGSIFRTITVGEGESVRELPLPKQPNKFAAVILWASANYVNVFNGGDGFQLIHAYDWLDRIGGVDSELIRPVYSLFFKAIGSGATEKKLSEIELSQKKSE